MAHYELIHSQGHRLGTADEYDQRRPQTENHRPTVDLPAPAVDPSITDSQRAQIRADRAKAAETRLKAQGGAQGKRKKESKPLVGPNSQPAMRWTAS